MNKPIFITGIGTDVGKTVVSAILTEAIQADYWKPVQSGSGDNNTDSITVEKLISNTTSRLHKEVYNLALPASPHIAARKEGLTINIEKIYSHFSNLMASNRPLVIEGPGGIMVPLNDDEFVIDLIKRLDAAVILVSRNYLGSINHSLLPAALCKQKNIKVIGWVFNDQFLDYEKEIVRWTGYPNIASIPLAKELNKAFIKEQADIVRKSLFSVL